MSRAILLGVAAGAAMALALFITGAVAARLVYGPQMVPEGKSTADQIGAGLLLSIAVHLGMGTRRILPRLSSGTMWTNLPGVLLLAAAHALPLGALGFWMIVLGRWAGTRRPGHRVALLVTHGTLLLPGTLAVIVGVQAMRAAERSTASGGGLLSPVAALPLAFGLPVLILALCSIVAALAGLPPRAQPERDHD